MFTWRRRNDPNWFTGGGTSVAYLRQTTPGVICYYAPCPRSSTLALFNAENAAVASYCRHHGRQALREYQALQGAHVTREIA